MKRNGCVALLFVTSTCLSSNVQRAHHLSLSEASQARTEAPTVLAVKVERSLPHEDALYRGKYPWTQGLEVSLEGDIIETSGSYPAGEVSYVRVARWKDGKTVRTMKSGLENYFVEGIAFLENKWYASTYKDGKVVAYDEGLDKKIGEFGFALEGWGFVPDAHGSSFLTTSGTTKVHTVDAKTMAVSRSQEATCMGKPLPALNELEFVSDFMGTGKPALLGNVYFTRLVAVLDVESKACTHLFSLDDIGEPVDPMEKQGFHVANGIAFNNKTKSFMMTGKNWKKMFEVTLHPEASGAKHQHVLDLLASAQGPNGLALLDTDEDEHARQVLGGR